MIFELIPLARHLLRGRRQELAVDQGLQRLAERLLGINRLCEPGLAQLDTSKR